MVPSVNRCQNGWRPVGPKTVFAPSECASGMNHLIALRAGPPSASRPSGPGQVKGSHAGGPAPSGRYTGGRFIGCEFLARLKIRGRSSKAVGSITPCGWVIQCQQENPGSPWLRRPRTVWSSTRSSEGSSSNRRGFASTARVAVGAESFWVRIPPTRANPGWDAGRPRLGCKVEGRSDRPRRAIAP